MVKLAKVLEVEPADLLKVRSGQIVQGPADNGRLAALIDVVALIVLAKPESWQSLSPGNA